MSEDLFRWFIVGGVAIATLSIVVQGVVLLLLFGIVKKLQAKINDILGRAEPLLDTAKRVSEELKPKISSISTDAVDITKKVHRQVDLIGDFLREFLDRARIRVNQFDEALDDTVENVHNASGAVKRSVMKPVREVNGILAGVKRGVSTYMQGRRASVESATQDEEMFI